MNRRQWLFSILLLPFLAVFIWRKRWRALVLCCSRARKSLPPRQDDARTEKRVPIPKRAVVDTLDTLLVRSEGRVSVIQDGVRALSRLISKYSTDVYLLTKCGSDQEESQIRQLLIQENISGLEPHKLLFCETEAGRIHMVRQLEPDLVVSGSLPMLKELEKWVPNLLCTRKGVSDGRVAFGAMADIGTGEH
ncbi:uncharacterized protein LOC126326128 [Schistocerca gregaria]|uniref:uncharacterized protein LOC126326128 n=1 Tax=Schistocerca gregaria TaxID=7010 RepID=UPI00211ED38E|nr:uncharacterized protein LOC126326128 [Schistocerca gregaria]